MDRPVGFLYKFACFVCSVFFKTGWRLDVRGLENIPTSGPVILAVNHRSYADPPLIGCTVPRPIHFLAKKELFDFKPFGWLIGRLNAHPLDRRAGIAALKEAQRILEEGGVVILFPEGRRIKTDTLAPAKPGVGLLAQKTNAAIVPVYIHNSAHMSQWEKITITYGLPIHPPINHSYQDLADHVMAQIHCLKNQGKI